LRRGDSPERRERANEYGIPNESDKRLAQAENDEKYTTEKALGEIDRMVRNSHSPMKYNEPGENYAVYKKLENLES